MTTPVALREAIRLAVVAASGLADGAVAWESAGRPVADPVVLLAVLSDVGIVPPREETARNVQTNLLVGTLSDLRDWTVQIKVETLANVTTADASTLAASLYLAMGRADVRQIIDNAGTTGSRDARLIGQIGEIQRLDYPDANGFTISARAFDIRIRSRYSLVDPSARYWIERAAVQVNSETADTIPSPPPAP